MSLPACPVTVLLAAGLNIAFARQGADELQPLIGKVVAIAVSDLGLCFRFAVGRRGFAACGPHEPVAVTISAAAPDLLRLALRRVDADTLFFSRKLTLEGDIELGLLLKNRLDALELSWSPGSLPGPLAAIAAIATAARVRR
jgi:predicted lipid carrier protein YhbT